MRITEVIVENFADGKKPGRKGLAKRSGVNTKASVSSLRKTAKHSTGEKARMAHWLANMKAGRAKHKESMNEFAPTDGDNGEEDTLQKYARMWYNGNDNTQQKIEILLDRMGWEIGEIESEEGGVFVVQSGDEHGNSYIGFTPDDLTEGWKDWVAGAAIGAAALGGAGDAEAARKSNIEKPSIVQQVSKQDIAKTVTGNPHEVVLKKAAQKAGIEGKELAAFLSQCAHETMDFKHMKEIGGSLDFKKYDPKFAPKKAKALGNTKPGDGAKYKGRGYIQLTGKYNYKKAGEALGLPLAEKPELVEKPEVAAKVAVWFWKERVSNKAISYDNVKDVTKGINPGLKHLDQRSDKLKSFQVAMK